MSTATLPAPPATTRRRFVLNPDEVHAVLQRAGLTDALAIYEATGVSRAMWDHAMRSGSPSHSVLQVLAHLGADPARVLILESEAGGPDAHRD